MQFLASVQAALAIPNFSATRHHQHGLAFGWGLDIEAGRLHLPQMSGTRRVLRPRVHCGSQRKTVTGLAFHVAPEYYR